MSVWKHKSAPMVRLGKHGLVARSGLRFDQARETRIGGVCVVCLQTFQKGTPATAMAVWWVEDASYVGTAFGECVAKLKMGTGAQG